MAVTMAALAGGKVWVAGVMVVVATAKVVSVSARRTPREARLPQR
jgi:hypothetical protein